MNQEQLNAIKKRVEKATPGPWEIDRYSDDSDFITDIWFNEDGDHVEVHDKSIKQSVINAQFIAHAREDVPALIAEVERLKIELDAACIANNTLKSEKEALEFHLKISIQHAEELDEELEAEVAENEQLREALEFYAKNSNYLIEWSDKCDEYMPSVADNDGGEIARQALGGEAHE